MSKISFDKPVLICLYGFPGSGKSYIARNLSSQLNIAHVSADRLRGELFQKPRYDAQEDAVINHLMSYITDEFLKAGVSVVYDTNALKAAQRRKIRELALKHSASYLLIWLQIDQTSAFSRTQKRDKRTMDDRFSQPHTQQSFDVYISAMQNPQDEHYMVVSGKHSFITQKNAIINKLFQMGVIKGDAVQHTIARPDLVNLIPSSVTYSSNGPRNISID